VTSPTTDIFRIRASVNSTNTDIFRSVLRCRLPSIVYCPVTDTVYAPFRTVFYETVDNKSPGQHGRSVNGSKLIKNGGFTEPRYFSYTDIRLRYRYGYITDRFTGPFTCYRLRSANEHRLRTVLSRFS
jgi:hypothetical protein